MVMYKIPVTWSECGVYKVEANSLLEAIEKVNAADPPYHELPDGDYIDDSMEINHDMVKELNYE